MMRRKRMLQELDQDMRDHIDRETQDNIDAACRPKRRVTRPSGNSET